MNGRAGVRLAVRVSAGVVGVSAGTAGYCDFCRSCYLNVGGSR